MIYNTYLCWWLQTNSKFSRQELEEIYRNIESLETPKKVWIPPNTNTYRNEKGTDHPTAPDDDR